MWQKRSRKVLSDKKQWDSAVFTAMQIKKVRGRISKLICFCFKHTLKPRSLKTNENAAEMIDVFPRNPSFITMLVWDAIN
jgi:hypothetical protein